MAKTVSTNAIIRARLSGIRNWDGGTAGSCQVTPGISPGVTPGISPGMPPGLYPGELLHAPSFCMSYRLRKQDPLVRAQSQ